MPTLDDIPPRLLPDVVVRPLGEPGLHVAKNPRKRTYLRLGEQERFLLSQLDGRASFGGIAESFARQFGESVSHEELLDFVKLVDGEGLTERSTGSADGKDQEAAGGSLDWWRERGQRFWAAARKQHILFFRVSLFDPDRVLNWLEPKTRWLFSRELAVLAAIGTVLALLVTWSNRQELASQFASHFSWETLVLAWATTIVMTTCHEFGHGLACKRYGGEVHEMGALWIFFTPCLYCNVSDAWLLAKRWPRLLIGMAGTYVDLLTWIVSVAVWRVTNQDTTINFMAWVVVSTLGLRVFFNINPLMRLDGYYALADLLGVHNLRRRGRERWLHYIRWMLWGGQRPEPLADGLALFWYGMISWTFKIGVLSAIFLHLTQWLQSLMGVAGFLAGAMLFITLAKKYVKGSVGGEFTNMLRARKKRAIILGVLGLGVLLVPIYDRAGGPFSVRPVVRWEVRAPVAGFLREVLVDEGDRVSAGAVLARMAVPELESQITRKQAEIRESEANLRRLEAGPRPEEVTAQRARVSRAEAWRDLGKRDLEHARCSLMEELTKLSLRIEQARTELEYRETIFQQAQQLFEKGGLAGQQLLAEKKRKQQAQSDVLQVEAEKRAREADGVLKHETELAQREKDLADVQASLGLLLAGSRLEDIDAERARLARLREEELHLLSQQDKQAIVAQVSGTITTPRLKEKVGQYLERGAVIGLVEDLQQLEAELAVSEQDAKVLVPGEQVTLKPRSLPFSSLTAKVDRIAPFAQGDAKAPQSTVTVYCRVENADGLLRTGMTGFGRIYHRVRPLGWIGLNRAVRFVRTEFWW